MTLQEQINKRAGLVVQMRSLIDTAAKREAGKQDLSADEQSNYANMERDLDSVSAQIARDEKLSKVESGLRGLRDGDYRADLNPESDKGTRGRRVDGAGYSNALFNKYARNGINSLLPEFSNALQVGTSSEGGYLVPTEFETAVVELLTNLDPIRAGANVITTASDRNIPIETTKGTFAYIAEEGEYTKVDPALGQVVLSSFKSGGVILVSEELLQDSFFNLESYLVRNAGERFNTLEETNFAAGNGTGKPKGIFATTSVGGASVPATTGAVSATAVITPDNLVDTFHALGRPYRQNASWVTSDTMVKMIRKLKTGISGDLTYLWQPGLSAGQPDTILGRPVVVSGGATAPAVGATSICLIDLKKYYIADRLATTMQRLVELYAQNGQVGFRFTRRNDGRLTDALAMSQFIHGAAS